MKQAILFFTTLLFISPQLFGQAAQTNTYQEQMKKAMETYHAASTPDDYQVAANMFEQIATNNNEQWQPTYYLAFINTLQAYQAADKGEASSKLSELTTQLESKLLLKSVQRSTEIQSEIHALLAMMYNGQILANPTEYTSEFGPISADHTARAVALNPDNPRARLMECQNTFYMPETLGGDAAQAKKLADACLPYFVKEAAKDRADFMPSWGQNQLEQLMTQMK